MRIIVFTKSIVFSLLLFFSLSQKVVGQDYSKTEETKDSHLVQENEEAFDITSMIMHHISDSHSFHVYGDNDGHFPNALTIPLPIILWTDNGLVTFMSSEFHHSDDGSVVVEKKGMKFAKFHNKIYQTNNQGALSLDEHHHPTNNKPLDFSITKNVFVMLLALLILLVLFGAAGKSYKKNGTDAPTGVAKFIEPLVLFIRDEIAIPNIGEKHYRKYIPLLLTIFFFVWLINIFGLIPFFPFAANVSGNIAFTMTLAVIVFLVVNIVANKNYWKHIFWMPGVPVPMKIFLAPIEVIGMFVKPISLMIRLFANITAGHIIVLSLIGLIFVLKTIWVAPVSVAFTLFISLIEILVTAIQAYIFTMLTSLYIGAAIEEEH